MVYKATLFCMLLLSGVLATLVVRQEFCFSGERDMFDLHLIEENLITHMEVLTRTIGERSVARLWNLEKAAEYIENYYRDLGVEPRREPYPFRKTTVANIVADIGSAKTGSPTYLLGAHYDSLKGTVGADDNASAVAVQLEVAKILAGMTATAGLNLRVRFVSFGLEEPPAYATWSMGSRVYAKKARMENERIDGMICLEMVGYTCREPGCQGYPFPLMFFGYPRVGNYIGIVGNYKSRNFTRALFESFATNKGLPVEKVTVPWSGYLVPNVRLSDHASFWDRGYKAVMITDTAFYRNPNYHRRSDTMDTLDFSFMAQLVKSLATFFLAQDKSR